MINIVRGPIVDGVLCAAKRDGEDVYLYVPVNEMSAPLASAIGDVLSEALAAPIPHQRAAMG